MFSFGLASDWLKQQPLSNLLLDFTHRTSARNLLWGPLAQ